MIHLAIDGQSLSTASSTLVAISGFHSDTVNTPGAVTVGLAAVQILMAAATATSYSLIFQNASAAGQRIGIGFDNTVTVAAAGLILDPGDIWYPEFMLQDYWAIASLGGGSIRRFSQLTT